MDPRESESEANAPTAAATISYTPPAALDQNTISSTTSKRQSGAPSPMITIPGCRRFDHRHHHHLEFVITMLWND
jgi:hypothetical protein